MARKITRREFLRASTILAAGTVASACATPISTPEVEAPAEEEAPTATPEPEVEAPEGPPSTYNEAPMLNEMVETGDLPPVDERLPLEPLIWDEVDVRAFEKEEPMYGGMARCANQGLIDGLQMFGMTRCLANDRLAHVADVASSWEMAEDAKSVTFYLRKGHRWSDGEPFTANDIMFWHDEIIHAKYLDTPMGISGMETKTDKIVKIDDYTIRYEFAEPRPLFLPLSRGAHATWNACAAHWIKQYHPDYTSMDGYDDPTEQFQQEVQDRLGWGGVIEDVNRPVLWSFVPVEYAEAQLSRLDRNPYFHAVDRWGNQMPYLDHLESLLLTDESADVIRLKLLSGEAHWERRTSSIKDVPFLKEQEDAPYDIIYTNKAEGAQQAIYFAQHVNDPEMRDLVNIPDFRRALSIAIDRAAINEAAYLGMGKVGHGFSPPGEFDPEIDGQWINYDLEKASMMLDEIGLDQKDDEGFRTYPNGEKLTFTLVFSPGWHVGAQESAEIAVEGWNQIGLRANAKAFGSAGDMTQTWISGEVPAMIRSSLGGEVIFDLKWSSGMMWGAPQYRWWQTRDLPEDQREGVEPEGDLVKILELGEKAMTALSEEEREQALQERREILADSCWFIGMVQTIPHVLVAHKKLRGVWGRTEEMNWILGGGDECYYPRHWFWAE